MQCSLGFFGVGPNHNHYLDKCVLVVVLEFDIADKPARFQVRWLNKESDWRVFKTFAATAKDRSSVDEITDTCLCLTRSWFLKLAADPRVDNWSSEWKAFDGRAPDEETMQLYDAVVWIETLHMCIGNSLAATHEFGLRSGRESGLRVLLCWAGALLATRLASARCCGWRQPWKARYQTSLASFASGRRTRSPHRTRRGRSPVEYS